MDPTIAALAGIQSYGVDDPVNGYRPPQPDPTHVNPTAWQVLQQIGMPIAEAAKSFGNALTTPWQHYSTPDPRMPNAVGSAIKQVAGEKLNDAVNAVTYPATHAYPPSFSDSSDPRTQSAIANAATVAQRLISPAGAFRPRPGVVGSGVGGVGSGEAPDVIGPLMQKAPWSAPSVEPQGIHAYHGSPHDFNQFDYGKIGTGEGNQIYGYGLYAGGREGTARSYRQGLSDDTFSLKRGGKDLPIPHPLSPEGLAHEAIMGQANQKYGNWEKAKSALQMRLDNPALADLYGEDPAHVHAAKQILDDWQKSGVQIVRNPGGRMYEVNIKHDPEHMLDWDKPINEQPHLFEKMKEYGWIDDHEVEMRKEWADRTKDSRNRPLDALQDWFNDLGQEKIRALKADDRPGELAAQKKIDVIMGWWNHQIKHPREKIDPSAYPTGESWYHHMVDQFDTPQAASEELKNMGIPGIRYLDAGSRGSGEGSRNYVSFDDKSMEILRKYGIAGLLSGGAAGAAAVNNLRDYAGSNEQQNKQALQWLQQGGM